MKIAFERYAVVTATLVVLVLTSSKYVAARKKRPAAKRQTHSTTAPILARTTISTRSRSARGTTPSVRSSPAHKPGSATTPHPKTMKPSQQPPRPNTPQLTPRPTPRAAPHPKTMKLSQQPPRPNTPQSTPRPTPRAPRMRTKYFVSANAADGQFPNCGHPTKPCKSFLEIIHHYCDSEHAQKTALIIILAPGTHTVSIDLPQKAAQPLFPGQGSSFVGASSCDFSACQGDIEIIGDPVNETTILVTPTKRASSLDCVGANKILVITVQAKHKLDQLDFVQGLTSFLSFASGVRVHIANLTFKTKFPTASRHDFFLLLNEVPEAKVERCRFPDLSPTVGAIFVMLPNQGSSKYVQAFSAGLDRDHPSFAAVEIAHSQFTYTRTCGPKSKNTSTRTDVLGRSAVHVSSSDSAQDMSMMNITHCEFSIVCDADTPCAPTPQGDFGPKPKWHPLEGFLPSRNPFAIHISLMGKYTLVDVTNCRFWAVSTDAGGCYSQASAILLEVSDGTTRVRSSNFTNIVGDKGSAIQVLGSGIVSESNRETFSLILEDVRFQNNGQQGATMFGGALSICLGQGQHVHPHLSEMNRVLLRNVTFSNCSATFGGAIFATTISETGGFPWNTLLTDRKALPMVMAGDQPTTLFLENTTVSESTGTLQGAVFAYQIRMRIQNCTFHRNKGAAVFLRNSLLDIGDEVEFVENEASEGGAIAATARSRVTIGGRRNSSVGFDNSTTVHFRRNSASMRGGAVYVDRQSTALSSWDILSQQVLLGQSVRRCAFDVQPFNDENVTNIVSFHANKAFIQGDDVYMFSLQLCHTASHKDQLFRSLASKTDDVHYFAVTETCASYLLFDSADTACVKRFGKTSWLLKSCRRDVLEKLYRLHGRSYAKTLIDKCQKQNSPGFTDTLLPSDLFKSWNSSVFPLQSNLWIRERFIDLNVEPPHVNDSCQSAGPGLASFLSDILLTPSPGEVFSLNTSCLDELGNSVEAVLTVQAMQYEERDVVAKTVRACFQNQCQRDAITFPANRDLVGLSIEGAPGSRGWLRLMKHSESHESLLLDIPFALSPCPLGFGPFLAHDDNKCQCSTNSAVKTCSEGRKIHVDRGMWVGVLPLTPMNKSDLCSSDSPPNSKADLSSQPNETSLGICVNSEKDEDFERSASDKTRQDMLVYGNCLNEYCSESGGSPWTMIDTTSHRFVNIHDHSSLSVTSCSAHRRGLLCGECAEGYSTTMYKKTCSPCQGAHYVKVLVSTFSVGFLLFLILLYWNWTSEMIASFSSLYFFGQAITFTTQYRQGLPHGHEYVSRTLNLDWSFGMCLTDNLNALQRLAWLYLAPAYLLTLVLVSLFLSRFYRLNRVFGRSTCIKLFWQFILLSFSSLASTSFQLLKCVRLHPKEAFSSRGLSFLRFADDASFQCFAGNHLPWAVLAAAIAGLFCIPLPISLPFLQHHHRFKPFYDVYTSAYKDNRRWWCSIDLLRRLLLAAVYTAMDDPEREHLTLTAVCIGLLVFHGLFFPFKCQRVNVLESLLLCFVAIISLLSGPGVTFPRAVAIQTIFFLSMAVFVVLLSGNKFTWTSKSHSIKKPELWVLTSSKSDDGTMLRERLLADSIDPNLVPHQ